MFRTKNRHSPPDRPFIHGDGCKIVAADPDVEIPWLRFEGGRWGRVCRCGEESWYEPAPERRRQDPLDPVMARHLGQCEFASEIDPAVLRLALKVKPGLEEGYDWVECGACDTGLAGSALRRGERRLTDEPRYRAAVATRAGRSVESSDPRRN
jgi:hypothetical protein